MSSYCNVETEFRNEVALINALMETGNWRQDQIEYHGQATGLYGYHGDLRNDKANIVIRRQHVGSASNDIGFIKSENGTFTAVISQYDGRIYNQSWLNKLKGNYAFQCIKEQQQARGRIVTRERIGNKQRIHVKGYR